MGGRRCRSARRRRARKQARLLGVLLSLAFARSSAAAGPHGLEGLFESPRAGNCTNVSGPTIVGAVTGNLPDFVGPEDNCARQHCFVPQISLIADPVAPACDPWAGTCTYRVGADVAVPENTYRANTFTTQRTFWFVGSSPPSTCPPPPTPTCSPMAYCGEYQAGQQILEDKFRTWVSIGFSCANPAGTTARTFSILTSACYRQTCERSSSQVVEVDPTALSQALCRPPRKDGCPEDGDCNCLGPGGSVGPGGDGPGFGGPATGPGARLRYVARGAGTPYTPGWEVWRLTLGRNWSHDYAQRIFLDPSGGTSEHVWLVTAAATFREFWNPGPDGIYADRSPADEYRQLERLAEGGWILREHDGRTHHFDAQGRWTQSRDASVSGNPTIGTYNGLGQLETVIKADGRAETFGYHPDGKLASITEVGVGGTESRPWGYSWSGHDLRWIHRPDGTHLRFEYTDPGHPGSMTRAVLVAIDLAPLDDTLPPERTLRAYSYDGYGNVEQAWTGSASFASGLERYEFGYDDRAEPTLTTMTVTIDSTPATTETVVYHLERPAGETKARVTFVDGSCPACGSGANSHFYFEDADHPYRATRIVDANLVETVLEYGAYGEPERRIDAANNPDGDLTLPRETRWEHDSLFPALVTAQIGPTTLGIPATRRVDFGYDAATGVLETRTLSGLEVTFDADGSYTPLITEYLDHNDAGRPEIIDPPGHGTADRTVFTYDPARGSLLPLTRADPLQGLTAWTYTPFNRIHTVTDASGVVTEHFYDAMDRPTKVAHRGADDLSEDDDLVTLQTYDVFGDLFCVKLPAGNGIAHQYDSAGRLTQVVRGTAVEIPTRTECLRTDMLRERTVWTLDVYGHRKNERLERTTTASWPAIPNAETSFVYATRCQLEKVIEAPGERDATTEYGYEDCTGNLTHLWDAEHPRGSNPASTIYEYDALQRLSTVRQRWGGAGPVTEVVTSYQYDVQDHLLKVIDGEGNATSYVVSDRDRMTSQASAATGMSTYRYDEHGELVEESDARGNVTVRAVDAADRVTFVDYPGTATDVAYEFGLVPDPVDFTYGRLREIVRDPAGSDPIVRSFRYDRFGRATQDGGIGRTYDKNGNPRTTELPGGVVETVGYDALDRAISLAVDLGTGPMTIASGGTYAPRGPLSGIVLGTSPARSESRTFDSRYAPESVAVSGGLLAWEYTTDQMGQVTAIVQTQPTAVSRSYGYQAFQGYLDEAVGPWPGPLSWEYDRIGNRVSETRDAATAHYGYLVNGTSGNTPLLDEITLSTSGTREYTWGAAGHLEGIAEGANFLEFTFDPEGRLARVARAVDSFVDLRYDGRAFLAELVVAAAAPGGRGEAPGDAIVADGFESGDLCGWSEAMGWSGGSCPDPPSDPRLWVVYDSTGRLRALLPGGDPTGGRYVFYLADRPVATLRRAAEPVWTFLTTDHLGTPILALDATATPRWLGGFEPFGRDWQSSPASASANGMFLRMPGQWIDPIWKDATLGAEVFYNVHRWYEAGTGRFASADPLGLKAGVNLYSYGAGNPVANSDPDGRYLISPRWTSCPAAWFLIAKFAWQGQHGNRYTHCRASCEIARGCGPDVAVAAGFAKEALDVLVCQTLGTRANCDSAADPQDIKDNFRGIFCLEPCDKRCEPLKGAPDVAR